MLRYFYFASLSMFCFSNSALTHVADSEHNIKEHQLFYQELLANHCPAIENTKDLSSVSVNKVALALEEAEQMDKVVVLEKGLLEQMKKLLPRYVDCEQINASPLLDVMDGIIAFLAVNTQIPSEERRAYIQYAMKLSEIENH
ncbi:hypothetical protein [Enterovibrio coralii]|uniref:Uncharacterized protein n=1 Tax=Enterovibrio coralii TaxID=294935 RepID=A0A135I4Y3_9GAMM|nr:hypothetical protein [Enterovibrio coralii]KXF80503.1 hypothetical protein ATN88_07380 [Enterovibrio coralii]